MQLISLSRKDTATGRQAVNVKSTDEARQILDEWDQNPVEANTTARKGGLKSRSKAKKTSRKKN